MSKLILEETTRNLINRYNITSIKALNLVETMKAAFPEAMVEVPSGLIELMTNDLKDRHVLATAVKVFRFIQQTLSKHGYRGNRLL